MDLTSDKAKEFRKLANLLESEIVIEASQLNIKDIAKNKFNNKYAFYKFTKVDMTINNVFHALNSLSFTKKTYAKASGHNTNEWRGYESNDISVVVHFKSGSYSQSAKIYVLYNDDTTFEVFNQKMIENGGWTQRKIFDTRILKSNTPSNNLNNLHQLISNFSDKELDDIIKFCQKLKQDRKG